MFHETVVKVRAEGQVHTGPPVVEPPGPEDAPDPRGKIGVQVEDEVGNGGEPEEVPHPVDREAAHDVARRGAVDIAVRQDHRTGAEGGKDPAFETFERRLSSAKSRASFPPNAPVSATFRRCAAGR